MKSDMQLTSEQIKDIEAKAQDILLAYFNDTQITYPIPIEEIVKKNGLDVQYGNFPDDAVSGAMVRTNHGGEVLVAYNEPSFRQNFTIAHEFGHFLLHQDTTAEILYRQDTINLTDHELAPETEANWFAASLLIPAEELKKYWRATQDETLLAKYFGVSPTALRLRVKNLGLE